MADGIFAARSQVVKGENEVKQAGEEEEEDGLRLQMSRGLVSRESELERQTWCGSFCCVVTLIGSRSSHWNSSEPGI